MFKTFQYISCFLVLIGAVNWGLIGAFNFNPVTTLFGEGTMLTKIIYLLVGIGAILSTIAFFKKNKEEHEVRS